MEKLIKSLNMAPHPEGGWYVETYRSDGVIAQSALSACFSGPRAYSTSILYLLAEG